MSKYEKKPYIKKQCIYCGETFEAKQERTLFCSNKCRGRYNYNKEKNKNRVDNVKKCTNCGKEFIAHRVDKQFCSKDCQWAYRYKTNRKKTRTIECKQCGKKFEGKKVGQKYCSASCRNKSRNCKGYSLTVKRKDGTYVSKHRHIVEENIGRRLETNEIVHHIDMNKENNDINNLYVFEEGSKHNLCHWSLNNMVTILLNKNIIEFDRKEGIYKISKKI